MSMENAISVIGLGKLGAPMCACLADKGRRVIGVDADSAKVDAINRKHAPVFEPGLEELIARSGERLAPRKASKKRWPPAESRLSSWRPPANRMAAFLFAMSCPRAKPSAALCEPKKVSTWSF